MYPFPGGVLLVSTYTKTGKVLTTAAAAAAAALILHQLSS